jgi:membrane protease YdiL (CAAX protease family)
MKYDWEGPGRVVAFLVLSIGWMLFMLVGSSALITGLAMSRGLNIADLPPEQVMELLGVRGIGILNLMQNSGMAASAIGSALLFDFFVKPGGTWLERLRKALGLNGIGPVPVLVLGGIGGLSVGLFPGYLAEKLGNLLDAYGLGPEVGSLELISDLLTGNDALGTAIMLFGVVVAAPLFEELIFRGYLWDACERFLPTWGTLLFTSALFGLFHMDPVQSTAVFFTGLYLGWLRHVGRSVAPAILAHVVNNLLAATFVMVAASSEEVVEPMPVWLPIIGASITLGLCAAAWRSSRRLD